jgi:G3E family GTPase
MAARTPIMLITGSLGSGKTTLLRRILAGSGRKIAVLMNEFGEIAIDSRVIEGENIRIIELAGGCVCCSMTGEFEAAVREIIATIGPEFIVVEATGVAGADALVFEVEDNLPEVRLDCVVCIVDADISVRYPAVGYTARTQLAAADILLINKADLVAEEQLREVEEQVRRFNDTAVLLRTVNCEVDIDRLFGLEPPPERIRLPRQGEAAGALLQSFTYSTEAPVNAEAFRALAETLPAEVFRAKGFVRTDTRTLLFNYVGGRVDLEPFADEKTRLVFIGPDLDRCREEILHQLRSCEERHAV